MLRWRQQQSLTHNYVTTIIYIVVIISNTNFIDVYRKASLFDQPLITEGKRERKPSQKLKVKMVEGPEDEFVDVISNTLCADEFSKSRKVHLTPSKLGQSMHSPTLPVVAPIFAPPKFGSTPFRSLTQQSQDVEAKKRSGHNILRKAKLQLNRAAVNRSKVALAKSLKKEMKREEKNRKKIDKSSLGYSTYSGRSKNFMDEDGPENYPIQKLGKTFASHLEVQYSPSYNPFYNEKLSV